MRESVGANADIAAIRLRELLANARVRRASDVHFSGFERPALRIDGRLIRLDSDPIAESAIRAFLQTSLTEAANRRLSERGTADGVVQCADIGSIRIHAYRHLGGICVVVRLLAETIPSLVDLALPAVIASLIDRPSGLILFTGPTGSGKTTALAAFIDLINRSSERNIVTIEDPIEYVHTPIRSSITHCEVGRDVVDYAEALRGFMRADPDVILIGEMRDRETIAAAITAAETGHLVVATLHTNDTPQTVDRIIDSFPSDAHGQVRAQLAAVFIASIGMRLVARRTGIGRLAVAEVLIATDGVRNLIREAKTHQLRNAMVTGRDTGMQTLEAHLSTLVGRGEIALAAALAVANRPDEIRERGRAGG